MMSTSIVFIKKKKQLLFYKTFNFDPFIFNFLQTKKLFFFFCKVKSPPNIKKFFKITITLKKIIINKLSNQIMNKYNIKK